MRTGMGKKFLHIFLWLNVNFSVAYALPQVESRTGEPVLSSQEQTRSIQPLISPNTDITPAGSEKNVMLFNEVEVLQKEISELKGQLEIQQHEIKQLKKSQQELYLDLDRRLAQIQTLKKAKVDETVANKKPAVPEPKTIPAHIKTETTEKIEHKKSLETAVLDTQNRETKKPSANETLLYHSAYNMVKTKRYSEAVNEFQKYLNQFPKGEHVANAHYWLGEMYVLQWQNDHSKKELLDKASMEFLTITTQFPNHTKTADALLKLGLVEVDKGNTELAKQHFTDTKSRFPDTSAARIAENRLLQLP